MNVKDIKQVLKERKITYKELSKMTGLSLSAIEKIFSGYARYPRVDTINTIMDALGLSAENQLTTTSQQRLLNAISSLSDSDVEKALEYLEFLKSQRK